MLLTSFKSFTLHFPLEREGERERERERERVLTPSIKTPIYGLMEATDVL